MATKKKSLYDDLTLRSNLPKKNAVNMKMSLKRGRSHAGPTKRYARGKVKK